MGLGHLHGVGGVPGFQASPAPGPTCPAAHGAGPPHRGPHPGLPLLRLEVGEGDVRAGGAAVLLAVAPVNLPGEQDLSRPPPSGSLPACPPPLYVLSLSKPPLMLSPRHT